MSPWNRDELDRSDPTGAGPPRRRVELIDTTLRDGEQAPGVAFDAACRLKLASGIAAAGVDEIEVGTPAMGPDEVEAIAGVVRARLGIRLTGWCRARRSDLDGAERAGLAAVHLSLPASSILLRGQGWTVASVIEQLHEQVGEARRRFGYVSLGLQDASRATPSLLSRLIREAGRAGADRVRLADSVGLWRSSTLASQFLQWRHAATRAGVTLAVHMHNDLGMATANTVSALELGADAADVTVLGLGERAGNAAMEQVAAALSVGAGLCCGVQLARLGGLCADVARAAGRPIAVDRPLVGDAAFAHESGVHVSAMLRDTRSYEPFDPALVGRTRTYHVGKHTGRAGLRQAMLAADLAVDDTMLGAMLREVRRAAESAGRTLRVEELAGLWRLVQAGEDAAGDCEGAPRPSESPGASFAGTSSR